jgi:putative oxidoreductase
MTGEEGALQTGVPSEEVPDVDALLLIGRVLFIAATLSAGLMGHLAHSGMMAGYAQSKGIPAARFVVLLTGVQIVAGSLMVALGIWPDLGALLLAIFLIPTAVIMHRFWGIEDQSERMTEQTQFNKDTSLGGAAIVMFAVWAYGGPVGYAIGDPLFNLG